MGKFVKKKAVNVVIDRVANWFNGLKNRGKFPDENPKFIVQQ